MGLFQRISDILSANFNEMMDRFEDPEKMLRQAIREMEQSIVEATTETAKVLASEKLLARQLAKNRDGVQEWQRRAELAVSSGDDDLARKALGRKQEHQKLVVALEEQQASSEQTTRTLRCQLEAMQAKLAEAKRSLATLAARKRAADFKKKVESSHRVLKGAETSADAFAKFDRLREKVEQAEAEADALADLRRELEGDCAEPVRSLGDLEIDAELANLKKQVQGG